MKKSLPRGEVVHYILMTMKYSAYFYMLICSICSVAFAEKSYAQNLNKMVTIHLRNVTLSEALDKLASNANVKFVFVGSSRDNEKIELKASGQKLGEVLTKLLDPYGLSYVSMKNSIVIRATDSKVGLMPLKSVLQVKNVLRISGRVTDEKGEPLPGVNIILKGTTQGSNTGLDGFYSLEVVDSQSIMVFSFVGYESHEVVVGNSTVINVSLNADTKALNEVVVVGYSSKQLSQLSSSVSVVSGKQLNDVTSNNPISLLQGKAPGVIVSNASGDPNAQSSIVVRGSSSITAGSAPLMVVDGIIGGNANPNDIESVTILKDAAATGLYGSRAANGVIIITTKAGKTGKTRIDFNASAGFNNVTQGNFNVMNSQQLYDYEKSFYPIDRFNNEIPANVVSQNTNWQDLAFRTGLTQNYVLSLSGGSEKTKFYISGNYYNEEGTLRYNHAKKYNVRANITQKLNDHLKLSFKLNARFSNQGSDRAGLDGALYGAYNNLPWDNPYNADGSVNRGTNGGWYGREQENFLHGWQYNLNQANASGLDGDLNLDYTILPNLVFSSFNRVSTSNSKSEIYYDIRAKAGKGLGRLTNGFVSSLSMITSNRLHYDKNFAKHAISALAVLEGEKNKLENDGVTGEGFAPGLHVMNTASRILSATGSINENSFIKGLVQLDYNYDNRYFLVASYINESSSRFGANNRSGNFYTLGASWVLNNENFMRNFAAFDLLKLRMSYGVTGNAEIGNYQSFGLYSFATQYAGNSGAFPYQMDNRDLTWEKARSLNFGLDIRLYKRLMLTIDAYNKTTDGLLLNVEMPYTSGFGSVIRNVGAIRNRGLELSLNSINLEGKFRWETNFNIAFNRSKVLTLDQDKDIRTGNQLISVGQELYTWNMRKWMGVDPATGDPMWEQVSEGVNGEQIRNTTHSYASATQQNVGSASPNFTGGVSNTWSYKAFTLSAFFNYVSGNKVYHSSRALFDSDGAYYTYNSMVLADGWDRWERPGDIATHPKPVFGGNKNSNQASSRYLEDGSYIRLRNINFSYQLPDHLAKKIKSDNLRIFVSADNLVTLTKFSGMDPEVSLGPSGGTSSIKYPISKKVLLGINIGF